MILIQAQLKTIGIGVKMSDLLKIFDKWKSDKGAKHGYHKVYEKYFEPLRNEKISILEVGVHKGASFDAWHEYFPNAELYGIDLFVRERMRSVPAFKKDRVHFMKGDSTNPVVGPLVVENFGKMKFDIIIDDGMHTPKANMQTYNNLLPFLKPDGKYFIEDIWPLEILTQAEMGHPWIQAHPDRYNTLDHEMFLSALERSRKKITRYDLRKESGHPDSYVMVMS